MGALGLMGCGSSKRTVSDAEIAGSAASGGANAAGSGGSSAGTAANEAGETSAGGSSSRGGDGGGGGTIVEAEPCDGVPASSQIPRLTNEQYEHTVRDLLGVTSLAAHDGAAPSALLVTDHEGDLTELDWAAYQEVGEAISKQVMGDPELARRFLVCTPEGDGSACLHDSIVAFGRRAFRRPLTQEELARFENIAARGAELTETGSVDEVAEVLLNTFLVSPSFLQRSELAATPDDRGNFVLSPFEVAARLSYMLWNSTPDEVLDRAADAGELGTSEQILAQAERMALDPRAHDVVRAFHRSYLGVDSYSNWAPQKDPMLFPLFTPAVVPAMKEETELFFETLVFRDAGAFEDLVTSPLGFVNSALAPLYGLDPADFDETLTEVRLDRKQRPGFLTRVGFLSANAHYAETAPVYRGLFVMQKMQGFAFGAPLPGAMDTPLPAGEYATNRQRLEALTAGPECVGCHVIMDAPGFVLESYDAVGAFQTVDRLSGAIDTVADVLIDGENVTIHDAAELTQALAKSASAQREYVRQLVAFAYRRESPIDDCWVDTLAQRMRAGHYPVVELLANLSQSPAFRLRAKEQP